VDGVVCTSSAVIPPGQISEISCAFTGRVLRITALANTFLELCEVRVFGAKPRQCLMGQVWERDARVCCDSACGRCDSKEPCDYTSGAMCCNPTAIIQNGTLCSDPLSVGCWIAKPSQLDEALSAFAQNSPADAPHIMLHKNTIMQHLEAGTWPEVGHPVYNIVRDESEGAVAIQRRSKPLKVKPLAANTSGRSLQTGAQVAECTSAIIMLIVNTAALLFQLLGLYLTASIEDLLTRTPSSAFQNVLQNRLNLEFQWAELANAGAAFEQAFSSGTDEEFLEELYKVSKAFVFFAKATWRASCFTCILSAIMQRWSWWQYMVAGVKAMLQITLWFTTAGQALEAQVIQIASSIVSEIAGALVIKQACSVESGGDIFFDEALLLYVVTTTTTTTTSSIGRCNRAIFSQDVGAFCCNGRERLTACCPLSCNVCAGSCLGSALGFENGGRCCADIAQENATCKNERSTSCGFWTYESYEEFCPNGVKFRTPAGQAFCCPRSCGFCAASCLTQASQRFCQNNTDVDCVVPAQLPVA